MRSTHWSPGRPHATPRWHERCSGHARVPRRGPALILLDQVEQARSPASSARARKGVGAAQSAVDCVGLTVDVGGIVAGKKQCQASDFTRLTVATQRVELADFAL